MKCDVFVSGKRVGKIEFLVLPRAGEWISVGGQVQVMTLLHPNDGGGKPRILCEPVAEPVALFDEDGKQLEPIVVVEPPAEPIAEVDQEPAPEPAAEIEPVAEPVVAEVVEVTAEPEPVETPSEPDTTSFIRRGRRRK